jgi:hypothetical protein
LTSTGEEALCVGLDHRRVQRDTRPRQARAFSQIRGILDSKFR